MTKTSVPQSENLMTSEYRTWIRKAISFFGRRLRGDEHWDEPLLSPPELMKKIQAINERRIFAKKKPTLQDRQRDAVETLEALVLIYEVQHKVALRSATEMVEALRGMIDDKSMMHPLLLASPQFTSEANRFTSTQHTWIRSNAICVCLILVEFFDMTLSESARRAAKAMVAGHYYPRRGGQTVTAAAVEKWVREAIRTEPSEQLVIIDALGPFILDSLVNDYDLDREKLLSSWSSTSLPSALTYLVEDLRWD